MFKFPKDTTYALIESTELVLKIQSQRDELLATLIESREALQLANDKPNGPIQDTIWMAHRPETLFDYMDAAIEKAKGNSDASK